MLCYVTVRAEIAQWHSAGIRAGWSGVRVPVGAGNLSFHRCIQAGSGTHPASYPMGTRGSFPGHEADHSPAFSAEVKNPWNYNSTSPIRHHRTPFPFTLPWTDSIRIPKAERYSVVVSIPASYIRNLVGNMKLDLRDIGIHGATWIRLAQDRVQLRAFVKTVMNLRVP
jgi:hypothetical protein